MALACLIFGILGAITSAAIAFFLGYGLFGIFAFYVVGGAATMVLAACTFIRQIPNFESEGLVTDA